MGRMKMKEIGSRSDRVEMLSNILALFTLSLKGSIFVHVAAQAEANCRSYIGDILASSNEDKKKCCQFWRNWTLKKCVCTVLCYIMLTAV